MLLVRNGHEDLVLRIATVIALRPLLGICLSTWIRYVQCLPLFAVTLVPQMLKCLSLAYQC